MSKQCTCELCERHREVVRVADSSDVPSMKSLILRLHEELAMTGEDLCYLRCIMDGSWPSAVEQLEKALALAKEKARNADF